MFIITKSDIGSKVILRGSREVAIIASVSGKDVFFLTAGGMLLGTARDIHSHI